MESTQIPPLTLPSGGTVEFVDLDDLTGADLHALRAQVKTENFGEVANGLYEVAMRIAIKTWEIPYLPDPRTPQANPAAWKKLKARDLQALEDALEPVIALSHAAKTRDDGEPGSPPRPESE